MIISPGQLTDRAEFYYQLQQLSAAGIGLVASLEQIRRHPPVRSYIRPIQQVLDELHQGSTFSEGLARAGDWLPGFDITLISAGEKSCRLDQSFRLLADYYAQRAQTMKQMISDLLYPALLLHLLVAVMTLLAWLRNPAFVWTPSIMLGLIYAAIFAVVFAAQSRHGEKWRAVVESILHRVPVLGTGRHFLALGRLSAALEALLSAGVTVIEAWELAAAASGSPAIRRSVREWRPLLESGKTPAELLQQTRRFPDLFSSQYTAGEISGRLDQTMRRLHQYYNEEGTRKLRAVGRWVPIFIYLVIMVVIVIFVVQFWTGYFNQVFSTF